MNFQSFYHPICKDVKLIIGVTNWFYYFHGELKFEIYIEIKFINLRFRIKEISKNHKLF